MCVFVCVCEREKERDKREDGNESCVGKADDAEISNERRRKNSFGIPFFHILFREMLSQL